LTALARSLLTGPTLTDDLRRIVRRAVHAVPPATAASITVVTHQVPRTAAVSAPQAVAVDAAQYVVDEGPCIDACRTGNRVRVDLRSSDAGYGDLAPLALQAGTRAVLSIPVTVTGRVSASLNLPRAGPHFKEGLGPSGSSMGPGQADR
jgi:GAF domain-containing protein